MGMFTTSKKDLVFFELFADYMEKTCSASAILEEVFKEYREDDTRIIEINKYEHECDAKVHEIVNLLNRSFVTPIDRDDIFLITQVLDNIMDNIDAVAQRLELFSIHQIRSDTIEIAQLITKSTKVLSVAVGELKCLKTSKIIHDRIVEVNKLENEGDAAYNKVMKNLFAEEKDPIEIIKWKEIIEMMESTLDACEEVAELIEGIVSKNA